MEAVLVVVRKCSILNGSVCVCGNSVLGSSTTAYTLVISLHECFT